MKKKGTTARDFRNQFDNVAINTQRPARGRKCRSTGRAPKVKVCSFV